MKHIKYLFSLLVCCAMAACSSDSEPAQTMPTDLLYDFATLETTSANGSVFTLRKSNDSPLITYSSNYSLEGNKQFAVGDRALIGYLCDGHAVYTSGSITLYGMRKLDNTNQKVVIGNAEDNKNWMSVDTNIDILTRTGEYVNMQLRIPGYAKLAIAKMELIADEATIEDEYPELHLVCETENQGDNLFTAYASFDISEVWDLETSKGVRILLQTSNGIETNTFTRASTIITPME